MIAVEMGRMGSIYLIVRVFLAYEHFPQENIA